MNQVLDEVNRTPSSTRITPSFDARACCQHQQHQMMTRRRKFVRFALQVGESVVADSTPSLLPPLSPPSPLDYDDVHHQSDNHNNSNSNNCHDLLWYNSNELHAIRSHARAMCRRMRYENAKAVAAAANRRNITPTTVETEKDEVDDEVSIVSLESEKNHDNNSSTSSSSSIRTNLHQQQQQPPPQSELLLLQLQQPQQVLQQPSFARGDTRTRGYEQRACYERQRRKYMTLKYVVKISKRNHPKYSYIAHPEPLAFAYSTCSKWATELAIEEAKRDYVRAYYNNNNDDDDDKDDENDYETDSVSSLSDKENDPAVSCVAAVAAATMHSCSNNTSNDMKRSNAAIFENECVVRRNVKAKMIM